MMGKKNNEIKFPELHEDDDSPTSAEIDEEERIYQEEEERRVRRRQAAHSKKAHDFIEIRRLALEEDYWTNLKEEEYLKLLDILDNKIKVT